MIFKLCNKLGFDLSSAQYFQEVYNKISQNKECNMLLKRAENLFFDRESTEYTSDLQKISEIIGIPQNSICRYERGEREPDLETLCKMIDFYEVSADWILGTGIKR